MAAAHHLRRQASRLCSLAPSIAGCLQQGAIGKTASVACIDFAPALLRQLSGWAPRSAATEQGDEASHAEVHADSSQHREPKGPGEPRSRQPGWRTHRLSKIYIPRQWHQQGSYEWEVPLVKELLQAVENGDAAQAKSLFEAALAPLTEALQQGTSPAAAGPIPGPYAWKLYFTCLATLNCHARTMSEQLEAMIKLGVSPQPACYAIALRQMAKQSIGAPAYTTVLRMKDQGMAPTLRCYMYAIESCLRGRTPELSYARRLFDEVASVGVAAHPAQKAEFSKLLMHAVREFCRHRRFGSATVLMQQLEGMGLAVPAFLVADVMHLATLGGDVTALLECLRRLEQATITFQEVPGQGEPITRPMKVEEGLLLGVLEVAASKGNIELAEAAWQLLERSVSLPNTPSNLAAAEDLHQGATQEQQEADEAEAAEHDSEWESSAGGRAAAAAAAGEAEAAAGAASGLVADAESQAQAEAQPHAAGGEAALLARVSAELEASNAAAAEAAEEISREHRPKVMAGGASWVHPHTVEVEAAAMASEARGVRLPTLLSHLALVHAYARGGQLEGMLEAVDRLQQAYPEEDEAMSYHHGLPMAVDALAKGVEQCDSAFYLLESWAEQGRPVSTVQLNLVVAACCQIGDLKRAFETFDAFGALGAAPNADTYNALMQGCIETGDVETALKVFEQMQEAQMEPNAHTHHQLVDAGVVAGDVQSMMRALVVMEESGHTPRLALLERCMARAERAGEAGAVQQLLQRLFRNDYRIVGVEAKVRRWAPEGGMRMLTGSTSWFSREEVLREMRKAHSITNRIAKRNHPQLHRSEQQL
ncbi:Pentatricopeptide repeat-containing protein [Chlorella vulgaris]